jgi:hypothetical protein
MSRAIGIGLAVLGAAALAAVHAPAGRHQPVAPHTPTRTIAYGPMSIKVPQSWPSGMVSWTVRNDDAAGLAGYLLPTSPKPPGLTPNPLNASPYFTETLVTQQYMTTATVIEATPSGRVYTMTFNVPYNRAPVARTILASLTVPPPITSTQVVHMLLKHAAGPPDLSTADGRTWLLIGGPGATAQEPFYLFSSPDRGRHWILIDQTRWGAGQDFPDAPGMAAMRFWSRSHGVIVEASWFANRQIWIYRTQDGGRRWTQTKVAIPADITAADPPTIQLGPGGRLTVRVVLSKNRTVVLRGSVHDPQWRAVPAPTTRK